MDENNKIQLFEDKRIRGECSDEQEMEREYAWFDNLSAEDQTKVKMESWEKIFIVSPPFESEWECRGKYVQATFWELRLDQVVAVRHFMWRLKMKHDSC